MPLRVTVIERHVEKVVVALAAVALVYVLLAKVVLNPYDVRIGQEEVSPENVEERVYDLSEDLKEKLASHDWPVIYIPDYAEQFRHDFTLGPGQEIPVSFDLPFVQPWLETEEGIHIEPPSPQEKLTPPKVLPPDQPIASTGRGTARITVPVPGDPEEVQSRLEDVDWVTVAAKLPIREQLLALAQDDLPEDRRRLPLELQTLIFLRIELERQQKRPDGSWSAPEKIDPYAMYADLLPYAMDYAKIVHTPTLAEKPGAEDFGRLKEFREWMDSEQSQQLVLQPPFYELSVGEWYHPFEERPAQTTEEKKTRPKEIFQPRRPRTPTKQPKPRTPTPGMPPGFTPEMVPPGAMPSTRKTPTTRTTRTAPTTRTTRTAPTTRTTRTTRTPRTTQPPEVPYGPGMMPGMEMPPMPMEGMPPGMAVPGARPARPKGEFLREEEQPVWAHDVTVTPGATYRYRVRVLIYNPLVGRLDVPEDRPELGRTAALAGEWSPWSGPVTVPAKLHFYFTGISGAGGRVFANVRVFAWRWGAWQSETFPVTPGMPIGKKLTVRLNGPLQDQIERWTVDFATGARVVDFRRGITLLEVRPRGESEELAERISFTDVNTDELILQLADGQLDRRLAMTERNDPTLRRLEEEVRSYQQYLSAAPE